MYLLSVKMVFDANALAHVQRYLDTQGYCTIEYSTDVPVATPKLVEVTITSYFGTNLYPLVEDLQRSVNDCDGTQCAQGVAHREVY